MTKWPLDSIIELHRLVAEGLSSTEIGITMKRSRMSVMAKCRRLKLQLQHPSYGGRDRRRKLPKAPKPAPVVSVPPAGAVTLAQLPSLSVPLAVIRERQEP